MKTHTAIIISVVLLAGVGGVYAYQQHEKKIAAEAEAEKQKLAAAMKTGAALANDQLTQLGLSVPV